MNRTRLLRPLVALLAAVLLTTTAVAASAVTPKAPRTYGSTIEPLASFQPQTTCSPWARPGTQAFADLLLRTYPTTRSLGIVRSCKVGGTSEHKEGRAFDWGGLRASSAADRARVDSLMSWLLATDRYGHKYAMARRLGIQYVIWNKRIWGSYAASSGWRRYTGANPHTDHVHFSLSWAGARKETSFWTGSTGSAPPAPQPKPQPKPQPTVPAGIPEPRPMSALLKGTGSLTDETVVVPASQRAGGLTRGALVAGRSYLVEAVGTWRHTHRSTDLADAECSRYLWSGWKRQRSVRSTDPKADHLDLYLDGRDLDARADSTLPSTCDSVASSTYRAVFKAPRSGRVPLQVWDPTTYADNAGSLRVRVVDLGVREAMSWSVPARTAAGVMSPGSLRAGTSYLVTVTGTWTDGRGVRADAECSTAAADPTWRRDRVARADHNAYDLMLNRGGVRGDAARTSVDRENCDSTNHAYRFVLTPDRTEPVNVRVHDPLGHQDNRGALRVRVTPLPSISGRETVTVAAARADEMLSGRVYPDGTKVRVRVSGTYALGRDLRGDAECTWTRRDLRWLAHRAGLEYGDLAVNADLPSWLAGPNDDNGCDREHGYSTLLQVSRTAPLSLRVHDNDRGDNSGSLTVTIEPVA